MTVATGNKYNWHLKYLSGWQLNRNIYHLDREYKLVRKGLKRFVIKSNKDLNSQRYSFMFNLTQRKCLFKLH